MSQKEQIIEYLLTGRGLNPIFALNAMRCLRLGARIKELRDEGYDIKTEIIHNYETDKRYAEYFFMPSDLDEARLRHQRQRQKTPEVNKSLVTSLQKVFRSLDACF